MSKYWVVKNIGDEDVDRIFVATELINVLDKDHVNDEFRFWPGSVEVFDYLMKAVPNGAVIADDKGVGIFPASG